MDTPIRNEFKEVDKRDEINTVLGFLAGSSPDVPVVLDREKAYGVLNEKAFLRSRLSPNQKLEGPYVVGTRTLEPGAPIEEAADVIATSRIPYVPVANPDGRVVGVVHSLDVLLGLASSLTTEELLVEVPVLRSDASVGEAIHLLHDVSVPALPVVDESGALLGVVHRRHLVRIAMDARPSGRKGAVGNPEDPRGEPVTGYLDGGFETIHPSASFHEAREALRRSPAVVVAGEDGRPRGVLTPEAAVQRVRDAGR